ncbi:hypothetical protein EG329_001124 [Mollisiaceae sp. DMI_Dod_QoI]|nr:hypothetical protein EG329_001124 [Helotiales sp. DMI_Dod_QoI]
MASLRTRGAYLLGLVLFIMLLMSYSWRSAIPISDVSVPFDIGNATETTSTELIPSPIPSPEPEPEDKEPIPEPPPPDPPAEKKKIPDHPTYKPERPPSPEIVDNFPIAAAAHSAADLPPLPPWNLPPNPHVPEKTPLFIGFTRNWLLLQQTVVSHITAGWPAEDIYVFENTGTMNANEHALLSLQNPFFLNHTRLHMLGVNIITTPTLLTFAQLQNFYLYTAIQNDFTIYFWGHMDVIALPFEDQYNKTPENMTAASVGRYSTFKSPYKLAVQALRNATSSEPDINAIDPTKPWAIRFFAYDRLALVNREAFEKVGGWDTSIPYYFTDCDMHERISMNGFDFPPDDVLIGNFTDVAGTLDDLIVLYRKKNTVEANFTIEWDPEQEKKEEEERVRKEFDKALKDLDSRAEDTEASDKWVSDLPGSASYWRLLEVMEQMTKHKNRNGGGGRNTWQRLQTGGKGEPYYRDPEGFDRAVGMITQTGHDIYSEKWGHQNCDLIKYNRTAGDEWRVERDWE